MLFDINNTDTLYKALIDKDASYEGRVFVCVHTTGIFCRLTCTARKPHKENCSFLPTAAACIEAGFRPCKRCQPLRSLARSDEMVQRLLDMLDENPTMFWSEAQLQRKGYDPSTVRRAFKRHFGMSFLAMARQKRLREGFTTLARGGKIIDAQLDAGFESASAFRAAFARMLGQAPGKFKDNACLLADWISTPLGDMVAISSATHLHLLEFVDRKALPTELAKLNKQAKGELGFGRYAPTEQIETELKQYFGGQSARFETPIFLAGSTFSQQVWEQLRHIPAGTTISYYALACALGRPTATRAVARANGANQLALIVPCHRVIGADGTLTGYGGGLWRKQRLIEIESAYAE